MNQWHVRKLFRSLRIPSVTVAALALALSAAPLRAVGPGDGPGTGGGSGPIPGSGEQPVPNTPPVSPSDVPEINPGTAAGALMILIGGTLLLTDGYRRRKTLSTERNI